MEGRILAKRKHPSQDSENKDSLQKGNFNQTADMPKPNPKVLAAEGLNKTSITPNTL